MRYSRLAIVNRVLRPLTSSPSLTLISRKAAAASFSWLGPHPSHRSFNYETKSHTPTRYRIKHPPSQIRDQNTMRDIRPDDLETVADIVQRGIPTLRDDPTYRHVELDK